MSDEKVKDVELKDFTKETLEKQVEAGEKFIVQVRQEIVRLENEVQQQLGIVGFAKHLLSKFKLPEAKKPDLEVK